MNVKILASLGVIVVAISGLSYGTFAFFSDTEVSSGNIFTAGDLDLTLDGLNGITGTIGGTNLAPGDDASGTIMLRNEGSIFTNDAQGHVVDLDLCFAVAETDDLGSLVDADDGGFSTIEFARWLQVTSLTYGAQDLLASVGDEDGDGRHQMLSDLQAAGRFGDLADPGLVGQPLALALHFIESGPNHLKRDSSNLTISFLLSQSGDADIDCAFAAAQQGVAQVLYASDFSDGGTSGWSPSSVATSPTGQRFLGELGSEAVALAIPAIPAHSMLRIEVDLYILSSYDGVNSDDGIRLSVDGASVWGSTFSFHPTIQQCYPQPEGCTLVSPGRTGAEAMNTLGYSYLGTPADQTYHLVFDVPHTAGSASIEFLGLQDEAIFNEAWGLDNVRVTAVPS